MDAEGGRPHKAGARPRSRRPTFAERRERRSQVDDPAEVLDAAARFLEARQRSTAEVRRKLAGLGYRVRLVDDVVARLVDLGYLDDEAFARAWVESRDRSRPRGEHALRRELAQRGVERDIIDAVLDERRAAPVLGAPAERGGAVMAGEPDDAEPGGADLPDADEAAARRLLARRESALRREPDPRRRRQRAYALLARSGFAPDICSSVSLLLASPDPTDGEAASDGVPDEP
jgi:SOS response regulatory protein OraA/RecX